MHAPQITSQVEEDQMNIPAVVAREDKPGFPNNVCNMIQIPGSPIDQVREACARLTFANTFNRPWSKSELRELRQPVSIHT